MKVIIAGSRGMDDIRIVRQSVKEFVNEFGPITEIVSGGARGVDILGERYGGVMHIPVQIFPANWRKFGRAAGPIRNRQMAVYADGLIAIWDGESPGTKDMIQSARNQKLKIKIVIYK